MNFSRTHLSFPGSHAPWLKFKEENHTSVAFIVSLLLHLLFLSFLASQHFKIPDRVIEIELTSLPEPKRSRPIEPQIVTPPDRTEPPTDSDRPTLRSDVDAHADKEQIHHGDAPDAGIPNPPSPNQVPDTNSIKQPSPQTASKVELIEKEPDTKIEKPFARAKDQEVKKTDPGKAIKEAHAPSPLKQLALDSSTLLEKFSEPQAKQEPSHTTRLIDPNQYTAFSRPAGSGARFIGQRGTSDYLPKLPDGDITLLNTKADQFAVFVRRVATQVFGEIRNTGWEILNSSDINSVSQFSTFRAILSPQGNLIRVEALSGSGSTRFDASIEEAVRKGAKDQNPPAGAAAADGNIHFIFQAKSWSAFTANTRSGMPMERRWLLLATGLE